MGTIVAGTFVTLDGAMQAPGAPDEDPSGGFRHGGWMFGYGSDDFGPVIMEEYQRAGALLLGRKTYEIFAGFWPNQPADDPMAARINAMPRYVVSDTLKGSDWNDTTIVRGKDLKAQIAKLRAGPDVEIHVTGSANLLQTLIREDLVDRYLIWTFPLVLGTGKKLFGDGTVPLALTLRSSRRFKSGAVLNDYARGGEIRYGAVGGESQEKR